MTGAFTTSTKLF